MDMDHLENGLSEITACLESIAVLLCDMDEEHNSKENIFRLYAVEKLINESLGSIHFIQKQLLTEFQKSSI